MRLAFYIPIILCLLGSAASAAEFRLLPQGRCFAQMDGQLVGGDTEKFAALEQAHERGFDGELYANNRLCLNSPGGSLSEGIKLANYLSDNRIGTRVEAHQACLSACALAFMAGTLGGNEEITGFDRELDVNGRLGFHRPSIQLNTDASFDAAAMAKSFDLALEATLNFVVMANSRQPLMSEVMVKSDLIEEMFAHQGQDFLFIDTVDKAARWDIAVTGWQMPARIEASEAWNACENLGQWPLQRNKSDYRPLEPGDPLENVRVIGQDEEGLIFQVRGSNDGLVEHMCRIRVVSYGEKPYLVACGMNEVVGVTIGGTTCSDGNRDMMYPASNMAIFPPDLPLTALPVAARQIAQRRILSPEERAAQKQVDFRRSCNAFSRPIYVTNVKNFVNLRAGLGFDKEVVAEVPRDAQMQGLEGPLMVESTAAGLSCNQACERSLRGQATEADRQGLPQCFEENVLWYRVETASGATGFVSGKFLRY